MDNDTPLSGTLAISRFDAIDRPQPALHAGLFWPEVVGLIGPHREVAAKDAAPLYSPCEWESGHGPSRTEKARFVRGVHFGVFDFDDLHESDLPIITSALAKSGIAHEVFSSFSHSGRRKKPDAEYGAPAKPGTYYQLRVVFPFSRLVPANEWKKLWTALNERVFGGLADGSCKAVGHRYYVPCFPAGTSVEPIHISVAGTALDVDGLLASLPPEPRSAKARESRHAPRGRRDKRAAALVARMQSARQSARRVRVRCPARPSR